MRTAYAVFRSNFRKELYLSTGISCGGGSLVDLFTDAANDVLVSSVSLLTIPSLLFLINLVLGSDGNSLVLKKSGPLADLLDCKISADIPQVPASPGLLLEATWFHS